MNTLPQFAQLVRAGTGVGSQAVCLLKRLWINFLLLLTFARDKAWENILFIVVYYSLDEQYQSSGKLTVSK